MLIARLTLKGRLALGRDEAKQSEFSWVVVMIAHLSTFIKNYQTIRLQWTNSVLCKLYVNEDVKQGVRLQKIAEYSPQGNVPGPSQKPDAWKIRGKCKHRSGEILIILL